MSRKIEDLLCLIRKMTFGEEFISLETNNLCLNSQIRSYRGDSMKKSRTALGLLVGVLLGIVMGLSLKSIAIGCVSTAGYSALFIYIFNTIKRGKGK